MKLIQKRFRAILLKLTQGNSVIRRMKVGAIGILILSAAFVYVVEAYSRRTEGPTTGIQPTVAVTKKHLLSPSVPQVSPGQRVEVELITMLPDGFEPKEINRPAGLFAIAVENRSGLEDSELFLDAESGGRLHNALMPNRKLDWKQGLDLPPGRYVLGEISHPEWHCVITITSK